MHGEVLFSESQRFRQWWIWAILPGINGTALYGAFTQVVNGVPFGANPMSDTGILVTCSITLFATLLFLSLRLETKVTADGIAVRFYPVHRRYRHYGWDLIAKAYIRRYRPLYDYGGWGIRMGLFGKGRALNVSGDMGLQIGFTDGKRLLIGTRRPEEMVKALTRLGRLK